MFNSPFHHLPWFSTAFIEYAKFFLIWQCDSGQAQPIFSTQANRVDFTKNYISGFRNWFQLWHFRERKYPKTNHRHYIFAWIFLICNDPTDFVANPSPEMNASFPSLITFSWFDGIIKRGWKTPIKEEHLYDLNPESNSVNVMRTWGKYWKQQINTKNSSGRQMNIVPALILAFGPLFFYAFINRLATVLLQQVGF